MENRELERLLNRYFHQKVKFDQKKKLNAIEVWEPIVEEILLKVSEKDDRYKFDQLIYGGGFYERTKTKDPNEFDLMLEIESLSPLSTLDPDPPSVAQWLWNTVAEYLDPSTITPKSYTTIKLSEREAQIWRHRDCIERDNMLSATKVRARFSCYVHDAVRELGLQHQVKVNTHGPAVTLTIHHKGWSGSVDLALAIRYKSWPADAHGWTTRRRNGWPLQGLVQKIAEDGCFLVAKKPKGVTHRDEELFWFYSFSQAEKELFIRSSCGEPTSCRRMILRILKSLREDLYMTPLSSYHMKTIMLYEFEEYPNEMEWRANGKLGERFRSALQRLLRCLRERNCPHYFIPSVNLFGNSSFNEERYRVLIKEVERLLSNPSARIRVEK